MTMPQSARYVDPRMLIAQGRRILIDTNAFLEHDQRWVGGLTSLVTNCADTILDRGAPLVILTAVRRELERKAKERSPEDNPDRALRAARALEFIRDLESDGLATTQFGAPTDHFADSEFDGITELAVSRGASICLVTNDNARKIATRVIGARAGIEQFAGRLRSDGMLEVDSPVTMYDRGIKKMFFLEKAGFPEKHDRENYDELARLLPEFADRFQVPTSVTRAPMSPVRSNTPDRSRPKARTRPEPRPFAPDARQKALDAELAPTTIPATGDTVRIQAPSGSKTLRLGERIGKGKEGLVYSITGDRRHVIKIFPQKFRTKHRKEKVELLVERELHSPGICFPESLVLNSEGEFVGYLMRTAIGGKVLSETITNRALFKKTYPNWRKDDLIDVCLSFLKRVQAMHELNILIGDMNEGNLMVSPNKGVWIIDTDSCQFEGYVCPVGWPEFTAPELTSYEELRTEQHELYAVAMVLFMILMTGRFAYDRADAPILDNDDDRTRYLIKEGKFPYKFKGYGDRDQPFGDAKYMWSHVDPKVKELFWETLHRNGSRFQNRPSVQEWIDVFKAYRRNLNSSYMWQDPMSHDVYPIRYKARNRDVTIINCPKCGWVNGIAGWLDDVGGERIPEQCNRCAPKCEGCGDPDQFGTFRNGLCKICRDDEKPSVQTVRSVPSPKPSSARPSGGTASTVRPQSSAPRRPHSSPPAAAAAQTRSAATPAQPPSWWDRVKKWWTSL